MSDKGKTVKNQAEMGGFFFYNIVISFAIFYDFFSFACRSHLYSTSTSSVYYLHMPFAFFFSLLSSFLFLFILARLAQNNILKYRLQFQRVLNFSFCTRQNKKSRETSNLFTFRLLCCCSMNIVYNFLFINFCFSSHAMCGLVFANGIQNIVN